MPHTTAKRVRRTVAYTGLSLAAVATARILLTPRPRTADAPMLDWDRVRDVAHRRTGETGPLRNDAGAAAAYDGYARELAPVMSEVLGEVPADFPRFQSLDRRGFIDANLDIARRLVEPLEELRSTMPESRLTQMSRAPLSRYVGEMFGFLSGRVLGQYDPVLQLTPQIVGDTTPASLFLVEPNLERFERTLDVPHESLRRWLILHELTHAWQFQNHPWLRDDLTANMRDIMLGALIERDADGDAHVPPSRDILSRFPSTMRGQLRALNHVQAVMSVLEGYSNFVMHRVGARHLDDYEKLEAAMHARARQRSLLERIVMAVTGMRMKMRQYEIGERFADEVTRRAGLDTLNLVWRDAAAMPTMAELRNPADWLARI